MKKNAFARIFLVLAMLGIIFGAAGMVSPAFAQDNDPVPLPDPGNDNGEVVIIPDTGADDNDPGLFSTTALLVVLGVIVVVLLIALVARGSRY